MAKTLGMGGSIYAVAATGASPPSSLTSPTKYCVKTWTLTASNDVQDITDTCSGTAVTRGIGLNSYSLTAQAFFDVDTPQWTLLSNGSVIDVELEVGGFLTTQIIGRFIVSEMTIENPASQYVTFNITAQSTGEVEGY